MKTGIKKSHLLAFFMAAGIGLWMVTGEMVIGGSASSANETKSIAQRNEEDATKLFKVRYRVIEPMERAEVIRVRGRTKADAVISIRAETAGILEERMVNKGDRVRAGQMVCALDRGARLAKLEEAKSQLAQAETDFASNAKLIKKGFASKNRRSQLLSQVNTAKSAVEQAKLELSRVEIRANASGIVQDPIAEVGDMLSIGATCVTLIDTDPMLFEGQISERKIDKIKLGMEADIELVDGKTVKGKITYAAPSADPDTRTFKVELELLESENLRVGVTANASIKLPPEEAYLVSPSWLVLADDGEIGLKTIDENNVVGFMPVTLISQTREGFWVNGVSAGSRIIVLGQNFISNGAVVEAVKADDQLGDGESRS